MKIGLIAAAFALTATAATAQTLEVTGEEAATYTIIGSSPAANGNTDVTTRRAEDGTNLYMIHEVSCDPYRAGLKSSGATLDDMVPNGDFALEEIVRFSAEDAIAGYACGS